MPKKKSPGKSTLEGLTFRYTFKSFVELRAYGINPMRPATYATFPPAVGVALIWAGQLEEKHPLSYDAVMALMPTDTEAYYNLIEKVSVALAAAIGVKQDKPVANAAPAAKPE